MRDGLPALFGDGPSPHLKGLPSPEPVEELQRFDLHIEGFFLKPLSNIKKCMRFASDILTKSLLADCVVLKPVFALMLADDLKVHEFQLIYILLTSSD